MQNVWHINLNYPPPLRCQCEAVMGRAQGMRQGPVVPPAARHYQAPACRGATQTFYLILSPPVCLGRLSLPWREYITTS